MTATRQSPVDSIPGMAMFKSRLALFGLMLVVSCGGGNTPTGAGGPPPPPPGSGSSMSAVINGQPWTATPSLIFPGSHGFTGGYTIGGTLLSGGVTQSISITLMNVPGPGTYPLGTGAGVAGGTAIYADPSGGWSTALDGDAGTITLTTLTDSRAVGTFSFKAGVEGSNAGVKTVTNGKFDIVMNTTGNPAAPLPRNQNVIRATVGGNFFNAGTIASAGTPGSIFSVAGGSVTKYSVSLSFNGPVTPGTYPVGVDGPVTLIGFSAPTDAPNTGPLCCWNSNIAGSSMMVTISSVTATYIFGSFAGVLQPTGVGGATGSLTVADGEFKLGLP